MELGSSGNSIGSNKYYGVKQEIIIAVIQSILYLLMVQEWQLEHRYNGNFTKFDRFMIMMGKPHGASWSRY